MINYSYEVTKVLLETKAVKINVKDPFIFASGIKSPIYCDNRYILGFPEYRNIVLNGILDAIKEDVDVIAGVATAGIPWASLVADKLFKPLSYIRTKPKGHGSGKLIEGADVKGKRILLIEDLITTGNSSLVAVENLKKEGASFIKVLSIFSYGFNKAVENYAKYDVEFSSVSNFNILIKLLKEDGYLSNEEANVALKWSEDPENWVGIK